MSRDPSASSSSYRVMIGRRVVHHLKRGHVPPVLSRQLTIFVRTHKTNHQWKEARLPIVKPLTVPNNAKRKQMRSTRSRDCT